MQRFKVFVFTACAVAIFAASFDTLAEEREIAGDPRIIPSDAKLETLWEEGGFTEGAAAAPDSAVYYSDFGQPFDSRPARIMRFDPRTGKTSVHSADSRMANGLMFDRQAKLVACCASPLGGLRALATVHEDGSLQTIVDRYQGKRFNCQRMVDLLRTIKPR